MIWNCSLNEEVDLLRETVRAFAEKEIAPLADLIDRENEFPSHLWKKLGDLGLLGITVPEVFGGSGMNYLAHLVTMEEISRCSASVGLSYGAHSNLCVNQIRLNGNENQKEKFLPGLCSGDSVGALAMSEPGAGSDVVGSMNCKAVRSGDHWIANGSKMWITNGPDADVLVVYMRTAEKDHGSRGMTAFLIEKNMPGFSTTQKLDKLGMRGSNTCELVFEDCVIPDENILPNVKGMKGPLGCLTQARYGIGWGAIGAAMAVYEASLKYAKERIQFDKPIASFQLVQEKLVWMLSEITKGQMMNLQVGRLKDSGDMKHQQVSMIKRNNVWVARECCKLARDIHGANGISGEYPIMRHLMNIESVYTYEGTNEMHTLILGQDLTDIPAFK